MILLWGVVADGPLASVRAALERRGESVVVIDQLDVLQSEIELTVDRTIRGNLRLPDTVVDLENVRSIYVRPYDTRKVPDVAAASESSARASWFDAAMTAWLDASDAIVINRPSAMASNNSKPYQAARIRDGGFAVPATIVTTDAGAVLRFQQEHGTIVYKSTSGVRSSVSRLGHGDLERLADIASCPVQFQQYIAGVDIRVHVVGEHIFASRITSDADDYRCDAAVGVHATGIPDDVASRCRALAAALDLAVAGIDLRRTGDGRWFCFEANPSPGFTFYEERTGQPIGDAIAGLLAASGRDRRSASSPSICETRA